MNFEGGENDLDFEDLLDQFDDIEDKKVPSKPPVQDKKPKVIKIKKEDKDEKATVAPPSQGSVFNVREDSHWNLQDEWDSTEINKIAPIIETKSFKKQEEWK